MSESTTQLRRRLRIYWALLPVMCLIMSTLFVIARAEGSTSLPLFLGLFIVTGATTLWWIFVPSSVIGRCPGCKDWFFASIRTLSAWPAGNPFRTKCWNCETPLHSATTAVDD